MRFSLLHPSRSRADKSIRTIGNWLFLAGQGADIEVIVSIDDDDNQKHVYQHNYGDSARVIVSKNRSAIDAINKAAEVATGDILIVVSDDTACPKGWPKILEKAIGFRKDFVLKVFDGVQEYVVTMPIMDRRYYERFGYVYHPDYRHQFCDTELAHVADVTKRLIIRNDITFKHQHYSVMKEGKDAVSMRADGTWNHGKMVYLTHLRQRFSLPESVDILTLCKEGTAHREWLRKQGI